MKTINYLLLAAVGMMALPMNAQETYENAKIAKQDLNGTARYVGMGGAMEALGADISTISTNPAGIGMFRRSNVSLSGGLQSNYSGNSFDGANKTNASFDQGGFVYAMRTSRNSFLNFAFNYHKGQNFDFILNAANTLKGASQNRQSYLKNFLGDESNGGFTIDKDQNGNYMGYADANSSYTAYTWSQLDYLYWNSVIPNTEGSAFSYDAKDYTFARKHTGYIGNYDFNISGNANDRFYWGVTFGLKDVHYHGYSSYTEDMANFDKSSITVNDKREITGTGFDITAGITIRPIENSPFRFALYFKTPTWYDLTTRNFTTISNGIPSEVEVNGQTEYNGIKDSKQIGNSYDFKIYTPWKFGVSLGHTVGNYLALGATYEYEDYGSIKSRVIDGDGVDYWGDPYETSSNDKVMNNHTSAVLKGVSTVKLGIEVKPVPELALRAGYNYVSPAYEKDGQKNPLLQSLGTSYQSASDYVNWRATNRFTLGAGYQIGKWNFDLAYQYSARKGDFYPFSYIEAVNDGTVESNGTTATNVKDDRGQLLFTLGYKF